MAGCTTWPKVKTAKHTSTQTWRHNKPSSWLNRDLLLICRLAFLAPLKCIRFPSTLLGWKESESEFVSSSQAKPYSHLIHPLSTTTLVHSRDSLNYALTHSLTTMKSEEIQYRYRDGDREEMEMQMDNTRWSVLSVNITVKGQGVNGDWISVCVWFYLLLSATPWYSFLFCSSEYACVACIHSGVKVRTGRFFDDGISIWYKLSDRTITDVVPASTLYLGCTFFNCR